MSGNNNLQQQYELIIISCEHGEVSDCKIYEVTNRQIKCSATWVLKEYTIPPVELGTVHLESSPPTMNFNIVFQFDRMGIPVEDAQWLSYSDKYMDPDLVGGVDPGIALDVKIKTLSANERNVRVFSSECLSGFICEFTLSTKI
jgi:hypothetical protein